MIQRSDHSADVNRWDNQRIYVMGLGRFGGGVGVSRYLVECGAQVIVGDSGDPAQLSESIAALQDLIGKGQVRIVFGEHDKADLDGVDVLVVNPAVPRPWEKAFVVEAQSRGIRVTTEIEIVYRLLDPAKVIAVTGSAGKSTTCAMIHHAFKALGQNSVLGGNIGGSLLGDLKKIELDSFVVLELSSAMLYWLGESGVMKESPPRVGCVINCVPNHIDWHGSVAHYEKSKRVLVECAQNLILGAGVGEWGSGRVEIIRVADWVRGCTIPGRHNGLNATMAVRAVTAMGGGNLEQVAEAVRDFGGLPHRLQLVHEFGGVRYFNDSKCTVPRSTAITVEALGELVERSKIHLIAGGYDKGSDLSAITYSASDLAGLYTIGATGESLADSAIGKAMCCKTLAHAMASIQDRLKDGDVVLLSPGCASWDQFANYEERGDRFTELARQMHRAIL